MELGGGARRFHAPPSCDIPAAARRPRKADRVVPELSAAVDAAAGTTLSARGRSEARGGSSTPDLVVDVQGGMGGARFLTYPANRRFPACAIVAYARVSHRLSTGCPQRWITSQVWSGTRRLLSGCCGAGTRPRTPDYP